MKKIIGIVFCVLFFTVIFKDILAESIPIYAKDFTGEGGGKVKLKESDPDFSLPYIHLWHTKGHSLEWNFSSWPGEYELTLTYGARYSALREMQVNGVVVKGLESYEFKDTGGWTKWKEEKLPVKISLKHRDNTLKIICLDETSLCLKNIKFVHPDKQEVVIDPKDFRKEEGGKVQALISNKGGFINMWDNAGHWIEWNIGSQFEEEMDVYIRYAALNNAKREIRINGELVKGLENVELERSGGWRYWVEKKLPVKIKLKPGESTLRMTNLESTPVNLNSIIFRGEKTSGSQLFAVNFKNQGSGEVTLHQPLEHSTIYNWDDKGHWLEWTIESSYAYTCGATILFKYAAKSNAKREIMLNGEILKGFEAVVFDKTTSWSDWKEHIVNITLDFKKGNNILRITNIDGSSLNLDIIEFSTR